MPKQPPRRARLSPEAEADLDEIVQWSEEHFGHGAAMRYAELIIQALNDIGADPTRPGSRQPSELPAGVYTYHLTASRERVTGSRVKVPRHFVLYRVNAAQIQVLRLLHDSRDLVRHLPSDDPDDA